MAFNDFVRGLQNFRTQIQMNLGVIPRPGGGTVSGPVRERRGVGEFNRQNPPFGGKRLSRPPGSTPLQTAPPGSKIGKAKAVKPKTQTGRRDRVESGQAMADPNRPGQDMIGRPVVTDNPLELGYDESGSVQTPALYAQLNSGQPDRVRQYASWWRVVWQPMTAAGFGEFEIPTLDDPLTAAMVAAGGFDPGIPLTLEGYGGGASGQDDFMSLVEDTLGDDQLAELGLSLLPAYLNSGGNFGF